MKNSVEHRLLASLVAGLFGLATAGCQAGPESSQTSSGGANQAEQQGPGAADQGGMTTSQSGLQYKDVRVGTGQQPKVGQTVIVHYTGWLTNGQKFDSSVDRGQPFTFSLGQGQVIQGWDEGVASMKVGGKRRLVIPPNLAYGQRGVGPIPANSTLIFDVELLGIQ